MGGPKLARSESKAGVGGEGDMQSIDLHETSTNNDLEIPQKTEKSAAAGISPSPSQMSEGGLMGDEGRPLFSVNMCGTLKKSIINSPYGQFFSWAENKKPGEAVFNLLLFGMFFAFIS